MIFDPKEGFVATMRRRLKTYLPLMAFALLVQLFAPISGFRAVAAAISDPLRGAMLCSEMNTADHVPGMPDAPGRPCCAFCGFGHGGDVVFVPPVPASITAQAGYQILIWHRTISALPVRPAASHAQARAPPVA